jgi:hypothetical protein
MILCRNEIIQSFGEQLMHIYTTSLGAAAGLECGVDERRVSEEKKGAKRDVKEQFNLIQRSIPVRWNSSSI